MESFNPNWLEHYSFDPEKGRVVYMAVDPANKKGIEMTGTLKPCPFCGGKPMLDGSFRANAHGIFCTRCDAKIVHQGLDSRRLIDAWNTRVGEKDEQAERSP